MGSSKDTTPDTAPVIRATSCLCLKSTVTFKLLFFVCLFFCRGQNGQLYGDIMRSSYYPCILYIFKSGTNFCQILCDEVLSLIYYLGHGCVCVCVCVCVWGVGSFRALHLAISPWYLLSHQPRRKNGVVSITGNVNANYTFRDQESTTDGSADLADAQQATPGLELHSFPDYS